MSALHLGRVFERISHLVVVWMVALTGLAMMGCASAASALPGGKTNWVVAVGNLDLPKVNKYDNWVRLGYYVFQDDGRVSADWWLWNQKQLPERTDGPTADIGGDVPSCAIKTVVGFMNEPTDGLQGQYIYSANGKLKIVWRKGRNGKPLPQHLTENWMVQTGLDEGRLARMTSSTFYSQPVRQPDTEKFSDYAANFGVGYGSQASLASSARVSMNQIRNDDKYNARRYTGTLILYNADSLSSRPTGGEWFFGSGTPKQGDANFKRPWQLCASGKCMGWLQKNSSCDCDASAKEKDRVRYIAEVGSGRQNTEWFWCQCLAQGRSCYLGNSHPRPMLQIIDDAGIFQGWVGVEAFTQVDTRVLKATGNLSAAHFGVFDMVPDIILPK